MIVESGAKHHNPNPITVVFEKKKTIMAGTFDFYKLISFHLESDSQSVLYDFFNVSLRIPFLLNC